LQFRGRLFKLAHHEIRLAEHVVRSGVARISSNRALQGLDGFRKLAYVEIRYRKLDESVGRAGSN
jgi:hypothetical protein